jgi:hypothetical protein
MHIVSTEFLEALTASPGRYVLRGWSAPRGPWKRDVFWLKEADGRDLVLRTASGYLCSPVELPIPIWEDFIRARLIEQDGPDDFQKGTIYRPTHDGIERGKAA